MSMNLKCSKAELWQTPSKISWMCIAHSEKKANTCEELTGQEAVRSLKIYCEWATGEFWSSPEMWQEHDRDLVESHVAEIKKLFSKPRGLKVWVA